MHYLYFVTVTFGFKCCKIKYLNVAMLEIFMSSDGSINYNVLIL